MQPRFGYQGPHPTREIAGQFSITSTARPGKSLDEIEQEINLEIERIKKQPPTMDEINRAYNRYESQTVFGLQTVLGKADSLNSNATFYGKPDMFQQQLNEYQVSEQPISPDGRTRAARHQL